MPSTNIADHASEVTGLSTSGASARVQSGESDLPKIPLSGGGDTIKPPSVKLLGGKRRRSRKSKSKSKKARKTRSRRHRRSSKK